MKQLNVKTIFDNKDLGFNLAGKSVRGGITTMSAQALKFVINIAGIAVLARILAPSDFGLIAMVAVVVNLATMFKDAGLSMATLQRDRISHEQVSSLFWINVLISIFLGACIAALSPFVAAFYDREELTAVTAVLAVSFILSGLVIQHQALLQRHMQFGALAFIQVASQLSSLTVTILLGLKGWGYWALVGGSITTSITTILLTYYFCPWSPGPLRKRTGIRDMLKFGGYLTGFNFVNYFARNSDNVLIGKFLNAEALGYYSKAYQILMLPISMISAPLSGVAVPTLSRLASNHTQLHRYYLHILYMLSLVASPIAAVAYVSSDDMINILLGPKWSPVSDVFKFLALGALVQPLYNTQSWLHIAKGRADRVFYWGLIGTPIIVMSFFIGIYWGINGVAICYSIAICITTFFSLWYAGINTDLSIKRIIRAVHRPLLACVLSAFIVEGSISLMDLKFSNYYSLILNVSAFFIVYCTLLTVLYTGFKPFKDLFNIKNLMIS